MPRSTHRRSILFALVISSVIVTAIALTAGTAAAHNTLVSSDPADGEVVTSAPTQITWTFDNSVPLETMTVTLIDATGVRSDLPGSTHGPAGDAQVVTPLPELPSGDVSLRWRLVGPDGHPITGRVDFTVEAATSETTTPAAGSIPPTTTPPTTPTLTEPAPTIAAADDDGSFSTPSTFRWVLRYGSYLAIMAVLGILLTSAYVWADAGAHPLLRRLLGGSLVAVAVLAFAQVLVIASDVSGRAPWASFGSVDAATTTDAGMALMLRIALALSLGIVLSQYRTVRAEVFWTAVSLPGLALLGTWAFAGHARSMRWPEVGVVTDVVHHAAAAAWIAGLAIVGWIVIPRTAPNVALRAVRNFSRVAAISVAVLVATGIVQSLRLVGSVSDLLDGDHGRYLVVKVIVLAGMLALAQVNRQRVERAVDDDTQLVDRVGAMRRTVVAEFALGLVIIGITASMVVASPATSDIGADPTDAGRLADIYYIV
jgi:copper transport protein